MTVTEVDYQVRAQFVHAVLGGGRLGETRLLARRVRMCVRPAARGKGSLGLRMAMKRNANNVMHHVRTMQV